MLYQYQKSKWKIDREKVEKERKRKREIVSFEFQHIFQLLDTDNEFRLRFGLSEHC